MRISPDNVDLLFKESFTIPLGGTDEVKDKDGSILAVADYPYELQVCNPTTESLVGIREALADVIQKNCDYPYEKVLENKAVSDHYYTVTLQAVEDFLFFGYDDQEMRAINTALTPNQNAKIGSIMHTCIGLNGILAELRNTGGDAGNE